MCLYFTLFVPEKVSVNCKLGDILDGIVIKEILNENLTSKKIINYKKSFPNIVNLQDIMNL